MEQEGMLYPLEEVLITINNNKTITIYMLKVVYLKKIYPQRRGNITAGKKKDPDQNFQEAIGGLTFKVEGDKTV